jgi:hypothetical protein
MAITPMKPMVPMAITPMKVAPMTITPTKSPWRGSRPYGNSHNNRRNHSGWHQQGSGSLGDISNQLF